MAAEPWFKVFVDTYDPLKAGSIDSTDTEPHDHGIVRALNSNYKPNKNVEGDPKCTLFIARLNFNTTQEKLQQEFSGHGVIKRTRLIRDIVTGTSKGYAFIEYELECDARSAYNEMNKTFIDGNMIFVDYEQERVLEGWVPRRLGGGIGGKKESGQLRFGGREKPFIKPIFVPNVGRDSPDSRSIQGDERRGLERRYHGDDRRTDRRRERKSPSRERDRKYRSRRSRSRDRKRLSRSKSQDRKKRSRSRSRERKPRSRSRDRHREIKREKNDNDYGSRKGKY